MNKRITWIRIKYIYRNEEVDVWMGGCAHYSTRSITGYENIESYLCRWWYVTDIPNMSRIEVSRIFFLGTIVKKFV